MDAGPTLAFGEGRKKERKGMEDGGYPSMPERRRGWILGPGRWEGEVAAGECVSERR